MQAEMRKAFVSTSQNCNICGFCKRSLHLRRRRVSRSSRRQLRTQCKSSRQQNHRKDCQRQKRSESSWTGLVTVLAAVTISFHCPFPALAAVQTVAPQEATSFARPLKQESVNKGKVWLIFLAGATGLFGAAVAIEKNSTLFPAIAKANQAMAATKVAQKKKQEEDQAFEEVRATETRTEDAVLQGFNDARSRLQEKEQQPSDSTSSEQNDSAREGHENGSGSQDAEREKERVQQSAEK